MSHLANTRMPQSALWEPAVPAKNIPASNVGEYSSYFRNSLNAMFREEGEERNRFLQQLQEDRWTADRIREELDRAQDAESLGTVMRKLRRRIMMGLILRDITGSIEFAEVLQVMSDFAEAVIQKTVYVHAVELAERFGVPHSSLGVPQDLLVVGMGKLGGRELNVSSDIDLIFFYDEDGECKPTERFPKQRKILTNREFYERLSKKIIPAISDITYDGFVFRVDMRLRPNGDSGPIVGSSEMLEEYLMTQGRDWERFAWSKGRIVSAPVFTSQEQFETQAKNLKDIVRPFVYRKYLDFGAISALTDLHAKIRAATKQKALTGLKNGTNVKLGRGGIREIEFIVQTFQVIRGGRNPKIRERSTLKALDVIAKEGLMEPAKVEQLKQAYVFLRNLEHAIQYVDDQQTQLLPDNPEQKAKIAAMMGFAPEVLEEQLKDANNFVADSFDAIFQTKSDETADPWPIGWERGDEASRPALVELLQMKGFVKPDEVASALLGLTRLRTFRMINPSAKERLIKLAKKVISNIDNFIAPNKNKISKEELIERFFNLFGAIAGRSTYVSLLSQYPQAMLKVGKVLGTSKWATDYLIRHPILLDELLDERITYVDDYTPVDTTGYMDRTRDRLAQVDENDQETRMNLLRECHHARLFRLLIADLEGRFSVERLADHLSALADSTLEIAIEEAWKTVPGIFREIPKFGIVAYGKLGGKELGYASDLDLIFLYDDDHPDAEKIYIRFARRLMNWLTVTTSSGVLFDIDMRLRPNGESGMLVSSLDAYKKYERNEDGTGAWLWEHQALTRGRFSAGDVDIGREFEQFRKEILAKPRDPKETAEEVLKMRQRMRDGHPNTTSLFDVKHDQGGMVDIEFMVQYLVLAHASEHPELMNNFGNIKLLSMMEEAGLLPEGRGLEIGDAYRRYRKFQHEFRLNAPDSIPVRVEREEFEQEIALVKETWNYVFPSDIK